MSISVFAMTRASTYEIIRFYTDEKDPRHLTVIRSGLTLDEAQEHCKREDTHGEDWFDGYEVSR
jgi:hypothetical protein